MRTSQSSPSSPPVWRRHCDATAIRSGKKAS
jgi:hypothetical protein